MATEGSVYQRKDQRWCGQYRDARGKVRYLYRKSKAEAKQALHSIQTADNDAAKVVWDGTTEYEADDILTSPEESKLDVAKAWLRTVLSQEALLADDVKERAKKEDISNATLLRAKGELGVNVEKVRGISHGPHAWH